MTNPKDPRWLTEDEQRARVRIAALTLEEDLITRIEAGDTDLGEEIESVQRVLKRVGREPTYTESVSIAEHKRRLSEALALHKRKRDAALGSVIDQERTA